MKIAYVTFASDHHDPDLDLEPVMAELHNQGAIAQAVIWDDPAVDWSAFDRVVVRSTWDYVQKFQKFRQWLIDVDRVSQLLNPREVIEPNLVKTYLRDLEAAGIPIVPTQWITSVVDLIYTSDRYENGLVIKPVISAGAADTIRTSDEATARSQVERILNSGRMAMAQPYLTEVDTIGEVSIVCLEGSARWAVKKVPALTEGGHGGGREEVALTDELIDFAERCLNQFSGARNSLYARVDVVPTEHGILLMELELAEPSLFIPLGPSNAAEQLVTAMLR